MSLPDTKSLIAYLKVADAHDKNIKLVQYTLKLYVDFLLSPNDPFEEKRKKLNEPMAATRRILSLCKPLYQYQAVSKEVAKWDGPVDSRSLIRVATALCTFVEQSSSDMLFLSENGFAPSFSRPWLDFSFTFAKASANMAALMGEISDLQAKKRYCASLAADVDTVRAYQKDIFRHHLAIIRCTADVLIYLTWIDNWRRSLSARNLNVLGFVSSVIGVYEVSSPHSFTAVKEL